MNQDDFFAAYAGLPPTKPLPPPITATATATSSPSVTILPPNEHPIFEHLTSFGHKTLWVVFFLFLFSSISFIVLSWRITIHKRIFHQLTTYLIIIATIGYFAEAVGQGWSVHATWTSHHHKHDIPDTHEIVIRQVYWARYVDWLLTTPLLLVDLGLLAGLSFSDLFNVVFADAVLIVSGWAGEFAHSRRGKWGWFTIGLFGFLTIAYHLLSTGRINAQRRGTQTLYFPLAVYTLLVWLLYPIIWGLSNTRGITVDSEVLGFAILDLLSKPVFGFWLLIAHRRLAASQVHITGIWVEGFGHHEGVIRVGDDDEA